MNCKENKKRSESAFNGMILTWTSIKFCYLLGYNLAIKESVLCWKEEASKIVDDFYSRTGVYDE